MSKDPESPVKLIDFGAAVLLEEGEQVIAGGKVGTWTYWAPEQADASKAYDQAVDMWSVGVLLYIMLSGRHPFERPARGLRGDDDGTAAVMTNILAANYSFETMQWNGISVCATTHPSRPRHALAFVSPRPCRTLATLVPRSRERPRAPPRDLTTPVWSPAV